MAVAVEVSKDKLRKQILEKRLNITNKKLKEDIITEKLLNNEIVKESQNILVYISLSNEVSTVSLIENLFKLKKNIYAPKVVDKNIKFYKLNKDDKLLKGKYGIMEPISNEELKSYENSVVIVPGLMFDKSGNRLGYGGGYYDRFLENKNIYKIGICFKEFLVGELKSLNHDIKMDLIITD
ncbi:MAG: 5-formyltetrahydrofolate cyclo-ligase [Bacilli bacterium]|nr:5-formyltetrahydrofolate cyclo-ligase [Bacilli bacterium]